MTLDNIAISVVQPQWSAKTPVCALRRVGIEPSVLVKAICAETGAHAVILPATTGEWHCFLEIDSLDAALLAAERLLGATSNGDAIHYHNNIEGMV
jgi:hypothetical protein